MTPRISNAAHPAGTGWLRWCACLALLVGCLWPAAAFATQPPLPGMLDRMRAAGTLDDAVARAKELGGYELRLPNRGAQYSALSPQETADQIMARLGWSLDAQAKSVSKLTAQEYSPAALDLNNDRIIDERDVLSLGFPRPKQSAKFPSLGTDKMLCLYIDYPDYPQWFGEAEMTHRLFTQGDADVEHRSLRWYYEQASYGNLTIDGTVFHFTAPHERSYYHPNDSERYDYENPRRDELLTQAMLALDQAGHDFSQYDNDGDGAIDYYAAIWTGPHGDWLTYWWPTCFIGYTLDLTLDGVSFTGATMSWQWEQQYTFSGSPPNPPDYDPSMVIHETGHALGLPDLYDYDENQGPDGGCGGLDMMDHNWGDHNCFTKYILGWLAPTIAFTNLADFALGKSYASPEAVLFMPGYDPVTPWSEYFMAQYRTQDGVDAATPNSGMLLWHVDSTAGNLGGSKYNNSFTEHKLLRLMEADGLEEIDAGFLADAGDYYQTGSALTPTSTPNSKRYNGSNPGIVVNDFSAPGAQMTADYTMYTSNPPQVDITAPGAGSTVSGNNVSVTVSATDDVSISKVQLIIDGQLVQTWFSWSNPATYSWNTLVEYNKTLSITARAWDNNNQASSVTIDVTTSNSGVTSVADAFEAGLHQWRVVNTPGAKTGTYTEWMLRTSPAAPPPLGSGNEAYINPPNNGQQYACNELLRSQRVNAGAYTRDVRIKFHYRCWSDAQLRASTDNGATWSTLATVPSSSPWATFDFFSSSLRGQTFYLGFFYNGLAQSDYDSMCNFNIDNVEVSELPSNPPTVAITAPQDGGSVSGSAVVTAQASDDGSVSQVKFFVNNAQVFVDNAAPWSYFWSVAGADNHPALPLKAVAIDNDGLASPAHEIHVAVRNNWTYPVNENLENNANWSVNNFMPAPDWTWVANKAHSGTHSYGWVLGGGSDGANYESVRYTGHADLSAASVADPVLRLFYTGDLPSGSRVDAFFVNTWIGPTLLCTINTDRADWHEVTQSLAGFAGYSGSLHFYIANANTDGSGVWLDDVRVENNAPYIASISPDRGVSGATVTIGGMSFGLSRVAGSEVTFGGGVQAGAGDFVSWTNNQIQVRIPTTAVSGDATVTVSGQNSNGVRVAVLLSPPLLQDLQPE